MPRPLCPRCQRPETQCYCSALKEEIACMDIIILQHPRESRHPLNTARILELGIGNCEVWVGEDFRSAMCRRNSFAVFNVQYC
ncbi:MULTISPECIES: DTW domain-containing protein [unclassified Endozoicomonas]|uniref:DTW domain-containing protein n=1 Tax=unclassified Endozoicomonas TaxID=2644528 RepID=UPI003BB54C6F